MNDGKPMAEKNMLKFKIMMFFFCVEDAAGRRRDGDVPVWISEFYCP